MTTDIFTNYEKIQIYKNNNNPLQRYARKENNIKSAKFYYNRNAIFIE